MEQEPHIPVELERYVTKRVNDALKRYRNQATVGFALLLLGLVGAFYVDSTHNTDQREQLAKESHAAQKSIVRSGDVVAVSGCNRDYNTIDSLRDQLERSLSRIDGLEADGTYSKRQADVARDATRDILKEYQLPDCREADDVLTAKPGKQVAIPVARYPNDPQQKQDEKQEAKELGHKSNVP